MSQMKLCGKMGEWVSAWLDGEVRGRRGRAAQRHLAACPHCQALRSHLLRLKEVLGRQVHLRVDLPLGLWSKVQLRLEQVDRLAAARAPARIKRVLVPVFGAIVVVLALAGLGVFHRGAVLSPEALAAEFPKHGDLLSAPGAGGAALATEQISRQVGFKVFAPDLSPCGFRLMGCAVTEVAGLKGVSFVYRRGCEVVVISQLPAAPRLHGFSATTGRGGRPLYEATARGLKLVVWQEGNRLCGLSASEHVFTGPMRGMRCH